MLRLSVDENDRADGVVHRHIVQVFGADGDQVGVFSGCQRADLVAKPDGLGRMPRREFEHVAVADQRRRVFVAPVFSRLCQHPLRGQRGPHLGEHVAGEADLDVAAEARPDAVIEGILDNRDAAAEPELLLRGGGERDLRSRVGDQPPALLRHVVAVDERQVGAEQPGAAELDDLVAALAHDRVHGDAEAVLAGEGEKVGHGHDAAHVDEHADGGERVPRRSSSTSRSRIRSSGRCSSQTPVSEGAPA